MNFKLHPNQPNEAAQQSLRWKFSTYLPKFGQSFAEIVMNNAGHGVLSIDPEIYSTYTQTPISPEISTAQVDSWVR
jgi:hypothetical protein